MSFGPSSFLIWIGISMYFALAKAADALARGMAVAGGIALIALVILTCASIIGRALVPLDIGLGPIRGIYDMTEIGIGAAIFSFLPWCQISRGHATVDLFKPVFSDVINRLLDLAFDALMLLTAIIIAWRLYLGMLDMRTYGDTTLIARIPVWQAYVVSLVGAVAFVLVAAFCVLRSLRALRHGDDSDLKAGSHV